MTQNSSLIPYSSFLNRCFQLAKIGAGSVSPNPMVGAVLVSENGKIIGEGWHKKYGEAHAEVNAVKSVKPENQRLIAGSTLYCSLEPCFHFGKTPPCVDLVLEQKIARVVISNTDPNPLTAGKSIQKMRAAGIEVITGILEKEGQDLNRPFFKWITEKKPYVILKWAQTRDNFIGKTGEKIGISEKNTLRLVHRWRSESDAIFVGTGTIFNDNPRLDNRLFFGKNPLRIGLDVRGKMDFHHALLDDKKETWILGKPKIGDWKNTKFLPTVHGKQLIPKLLQELFLAKKQILLVEGGANIHHQFLEKNEWDEIRILQNDSDLLAGVAASKLPENAVLVEKFQLGNDTIYMYQNSAPIFKIQ